MSDDDDFGDLYAEDVGGGGGGGGGGTGTLYEASKEVRVEESWGYGGEGDVNDEDREDEEELLYGTSSASAVAPAVVGGLTAGFEVGVKDVDNEETFLYGELYGSAAAAATTTSKGDGLESASVEDTRSREAGAAAAIENGNSYGAESDASGLLGRMQPQTPGTVGGLRALESFRGVGGIVVAPGLAPSGSVGLREKEEVTAGEMGDDSAAAAGVAGTGEGEDWDSDSDDGLQIVLNDDAPAFGNPEGEAKSEYYEGSDDEDEEDLIIVAEDEPLDGQENWGEEGGPLSEPPLSGPPSGGPPGALERVVSGENSFSIYV